MQVSDYLNPVRYSVDGLMPLLWHEHDQEERLHRLYPPVPLEPAAAFVGPDVS